MGVSTRLTPREGRRFAFPVAAAFAVLGGVSYWRGHQLPPLILWGLSGLLFLAGVVIPGKLGPVYHYWMALAEKISKVTAPITVGVFFYGVLTPIGFLMRRFGRNPLRHREQEGGFWFPCTSGEGSNLDNQY